MKELNLRPRVCSMRAIECGKFLRLCFCRDLFQLVCTLGEPDQLHGEAVVLPLLQVPARHRTNTSQEEASGTARVSIHSNIYGVYLYWISARN